LELVLIKPGEFETGVTSADLYPGELSPRRVAFDRPFYIAATETTNEQYAQFAEAVGSAQAGTDWKNAWDEQDAGERLPVVGVSVTQAEAFCAWLGGRLPTEDEWEFAARGPDGGSVDRPWGKEPLDPGRANLYFGDDPNPVPVDSLPDGNTPTGLSHMLGNVAEWCSDAYRGGFGEGESSPEFAGKNAIRGCSFTKSADAEARLTWRAPEGPDGRPDVGFRMVFDVGE
jgi:formylglycine-generating enzyme required for sulfatase activity